MKNLKSLFSFALKFKKHIFLGVTFSILMVFFSLASAGTLMPILKIMFGGAEYSEIPVKPVFESVFKLDEYAGNWLNFKIYTWIEEMGKVALLGWICVVAGTMFLIKNIFRYGSTYFLAHVKNGLISSMRENMYKKISTLHISFFSEKNRGDILARFSSDISQVQNAIVVFTEVVFRDPLMIVSSITILFMISGKLTLFILVALPIMGGLISIVGNSLKRNSTKAQNQEGVIISLVEELLHGLKIVKIFNASEVLHEKFEKNSDEWLKLNNKVMRRKDLASPMSETLGVFLFILILWFGGRLILGGDSFLNAEMFLTYLVIFFQVVEPTKSLVKMFYHLKNGDAAAERINQLLETPNQIQSRKELTSPNKLEAKIEFKNICFEYEGSERQVLKNVNFSISKGEKVALVGASGSGKTTLAHLITRFYDPSAGSIEIDGTDIRDLKLETLRSMFGFVSQEPILFNDTVRKNLLLGKPNASDEELKQAMDMAHVSEFVSGLEGGLEFNIGYGGEKLSGGQRQRMSIARAIAYDPDILVFDEATSALDNESEHLVQEAIDKGMQNRTSVIIAHRLSTIKNVDKIVVLDQGEIVEIGTHQELLDNQGHYHNLVQYMK